MDDAGTMLELALHPYGRVSGTMRPAVDSPTYRSYPVAGSYLVRLRGDRGIVGSVSGWPHQGSITIWCGEYESSADRLTVRWLVPADMARPGDAPPPGGVEFRRPPG